LNAMLACVADGRRARDRERLPFRTCLSASVAVHPDRLPALHAVRPHVASTLRMLVHWDLSDAAREAQARIRSAYDMFEHMSPDAGHADLVPDDVVSEFAIAGTPQDCIRQSIDLFAAGIDEITIRPYGVSGGSRAATMEQFATEVVQPVLEHFRST
jgi:5,10-methylenetetrahydromethanopterin reductase